MTSNVSKKKNQSSMQVIKTLQVLLQDNLHMQEIVDRLNAKENEPIFNNSVVSKYINTCRACGIEIPKINNRYYVTKMPFGIDFTQEETELLSKLQQSANLLSVKNYSIFSKFFEKLSRFSNKKLVRVQKNSYQISFELFERAIAHKQKVKIIFRNKSEFIGIPLKIVEGGKKTFFNLYCKNRERMIDVDRVSAIEITNEKFISTFNEQAVIFSLKSPLAERYELRENEELRIKNDDKITVSNKGENLEILLSRLLRYDDLCEVLTPSHRMAMKQIINDTLKNYGED